MIKRMLCACLAAVTAACFLSSCNAITGETEDLLRAPEATGVMGEIQRALYDSAGNNISLRYPRSGDNRTAFFLCDLDGDGTDEAVAFYAHDANADPNGVAPVHINVLDCVDDTWKSVCDNETTGNAIDRVAVADLSGSGKLSLLVGVELFASTGNQLNLYTYKNNKLTQYAQENYTEFLTGDLMQTGNDQLIVLALDTTERTSNVTVYTFNGEALERRGTASTDGNVSGYAQVMLGKLDSNQPALFVDANKSTLSMVTDVVYYRDKTFISPFFDRTVGESQLTVHNTTDVCRDYDGDGVTDIPFTQILPGFSLKSEADRQYLTTWKSFDGQYFRELICADFYRAAGFRLAFPASWVGNVTVVSDTASKMRSYRIWDPEQQTAGTEILRIRAYSVAAFEKLDASDVIELARDNTTVWAGRLIVTEGEYALTEEQLRNLFALE